MKLNDLAFGGIHCLASHIACSCVFPGLVWTPSRNVFPYRPLALIIILSSLFHLRVRKYGVYVAKITFSTSRTPTKANKPVNNNPTPNSVEMNS